jgi:hypothetical protein
LFFQYIGKKSDVFEKKQKPNLGRKQVSIIATDWHVPYHDKEKVKRLVDEWGSKGKKADRLIIGGDFLNGDKLSIHVKMVHEDFKKEMTEGRLLLEYLASEFPEVVLVDDNHVHSRWQKLLGTVLSPDLHFLTVHPYDYLTAGLENVVRAGNTIPSELGKEFGWLYNIGDAVIAHSEVSSSQEMKSVRATQAFVNKWRPVLNIPEIKFVAQSHVHKLAMYHDYDSAVALTGCMVSLEGLKYSMGAKAAGGPPIHGYIVLVQEDGKTNLEETKVVRL